MAKPGILDQLSAKGADISAIADRFIKNSKQIPLLIEAVRTEKSSKKFAYEKTLRLISEREPGLIYPYFDVCIGLLDSENSFLKWGSIITVANLTTVDAEKKFETVFKKYYAPICGPAMITAANIIGSSVIIARAKPDLVNSITNEILKVEKARFLRKGIPSPECRNVVIGQAIDSLDKFYDRISDKASVVKFVKCQLKNTRMQVVKKAEKFLKKHVPSKDTLDQKKSAGSRLKRITGSGFSRRQKTI